VTTVWAWGVQFPLRICSGFVTLIANS
jgi:hypothetical protein